MKIIAAIAVVVLIGGLACYRDIGLREQRAFEAIERLEESETDLRKIDADKALAEVSHAFPFSPRSYGDLMQYRSAVTMARIEGDHVSSLVNACKQEARIAIGTETSETAATVYSVSQGDCKKERAKQDASSMAVAQKIISDYHDQQNADAAERVATRKVVDIRHGQSQSRHLQQCLSGMVGGDTEINKEWCNDHPDWVPATSASNQ